LKDAEDVEEMTEAQQFATLATTGWPEENATAQALRADVLDSQEECNSIDGVASEIPVQTATKRTYQPHVIRRKRKHGFFARKGTKGGLRVLARRLLKGRRKLSAWTKPKQDEMDACRLLWDEIARLLWICSVVQQWCPFKCGFMPLHVWLVHKVFVVSWKVVPAVVGNECPMWWLLLECTLIEVVLGEKD